MADKYFQDLTTIRKDPELAIVTIQQLVPTSIHHLIGRWIKHATDTYVGNPTFTEAELVHNFLTDISELGDPAYEVSEEKDFATMRRLHEAGCAIIAEACRLARKVDDANYPDTAGRSNYEYLQATLDFDQLCEDIANKMEDPST
jgi:hypothetical protein